MTAPISPFALHIWDNHDPSPNAKSEIRRKKALRRLSVLPLTQETETQLQRIMDYYDNSPTHQLIEYCTHRSSLASKMDFCTKHGCW